MYDFTGCCIVTCLCMTPVRVFCRYVSNVYYNCMHSVGICYVHCVCVLDCLIAFDCTREVFVECHCLRNWIVQMFVIVVLHNCYVRLC